MKCPECDALAIVWWESRIAQRFSDGSIDDGAETYHCPRGHEWTVER